MHAVLLVPLLSAGLLALLPDYRLAAKINVGAAFLTLVAALSLFAARPAPSAYVMIDDLNIVFVALSTFVGFTTCVFSASYVEHEVEIGRLTPTYLRFYHAMYQVLMFAMNLALIANNIGLMWVAIEIATLTTVLMVGIYRTHEALEAAWKYFILGSVGIAFALFGTILVYMAARPVVGEGIEAMVWSALVEHAAAFDPALLNLAFIFLLLGYGTKVGLAPLHAWLPDAHAEGPTPISAVLSGLLLNVALYAVLRFKILLAGNPEALAPGPLMVILGLVSLIFAALMLYRRRDIKRMFAYSSIEHMGIIVFAFGMGGPLANFAGLLHMTMHSLTKSAIFFSVGHIAQVKGTQRMSDIGGLTETHPWLGWGLVLGVVAICRHAAARHLHERVPDRELDLRARAASCDPARRRPADRHRRAVPAAEPDRLRRAARPGRARDGLLRADVRAPRAGAWAPGFSCPARWSPGSSMSRGCSGRRSAACRPRDLIAAGIRVGAHRPWPRALVGADLWRAATDALADGALTLVGFWGDEGTVQMALSEGAEFAVISLDCPSGRFPSVGKTHPPAIRLERTIADLYGRHWSGYGAIDGTVHMALSTGTYFAILSLDCPERKIPFGRSGPPAGHSARTRDPRSLRPRTRRAPTIAAPGSITAAGASRIRSAKHRRPLRVHRPTPSCRSRAKACTRSRSDRFTPASSSRDISASRQMARRSCGWRSASATCTRVSRG